MHFSVNVWCARASSGGDEHRYPFWMTLVPREFGLTDLKAARACVVYHDDDWPLGQSRRWRLPDTLVIISAHTDKLLTYDERTRAVIFDLEPDSSVRRQGDAG